jgi:hypothetical protein
MKKIKLAVGIVALSISASASAMPDEVPSFWTALMNRTWAIVADHRPCNRQWQHVCDGHL